MNYRSLYRKYRPKNFNEIYGQDVIVKILNNSLKNNSFSHAYLFSGPRGSGKTSTAKIFARLINCDNYKDGKCCEKCENCINSADENCVDIIEMDAASNNGVDEIRELKNNAMVSPSFLKYKVYIIDEVHMLSNSAFNALLKTLEEPPEHVIFILATTNIEKVPITIISRCHTMEFKKINNKDMILRIKEIATKEKIKIDDDAIQEICNDSDGGLRDAIGMLELANSYCEDKITSEDINIINGNVSNKEIEILYDNILNSNINEAIESIEKYSESGKDLKKICKALLEYLINDNIKKTTTNKCLIGNTLIQCLSDMKKTTLDKVVFINTILSIGNNKQDSDVSLSNTDDFVLTNFDKKNEDISFASKKEDVSFESKNDNIIDKNEEDKNKIINNVDEIKKIRINNTFVDASKQELSDIKDKWKNLVDYCLDKSYGSFISTLVDAKPVASGKNNTILTYKYQSFCDNGNSNIEKYEEAISKLLDINKKLIFITDDEWTLEKNEYIKNLKNKVEYKYIEEPKKEDNIQKDITNEESDIIKKANEMFDKSIIEIEE